MKLPRIIRDVGYQATGNYVQVGTQAVRGLFLARLLGPAGFGLTSAVNLIVAYLLYLDLGVSQGVMREIPVELGREAPAEADAWESCGLVARVVSGLVGALILAGYTLLHWSSLSPTYRWCLLTGCAILAAQSVTSYAQIVLQVRREFRLLAFLVVSVAVGNLLVSVVGGLVGGPTGVLVGQAIVLALGGGYVVRRLVPPHLSMVSRRRLLRLLYIGGPLLAIQVLGTNLVSVDQIIATSLLGVASLGLYTLAMFAGQILQLVALSLGGAVGPRLLNAYGRRHRLEDVRELTWRPVRLLSLILPPIVVFMWLMGPLFIDWLLPAYVPVIGALRVNVVGVFFLSLNFGVSTLLVALKKHWLNIPIVGTCLVINIIIDLVLVRHFDMGLIGIATGSLITYFLYWFAHTLLVRWFFERQVWRSVFMNLATAWPGLLLVALLGVAASRGYLSRSAPVVETLVLVLITGLSVVRWLYGRGRGGPGGVGLGRPRLDDEQDAAATVPTGGVTF